MEINEVIERLKEGNVRFVADKADNELVHSIRRAELTSSQAPYAIILGCADSRVVPELIFDTGLGELFTVRVAGNIANPASIASIEYAVAHLNTRVIVVLGHEACGAVAAAIDGGDTGYNLNLLLAHITPAKEQVKDNDITSVIRKNVEHTANELKTRSTIIADAVKSERVQIFSAYYHLGSGEVEYLES